MRSATTATGRPLPPPGKTLPKNRPAPPSCRATHQLAASKPHVTSKLQCYIPALIDNRRRSPRKINRQPRRLEFAISPTKQTPAPQINRQQIATSRMTHLSISNRHNQHAASALSPLLTRHCRSNRHTPRLENAISRRKQTLGTLSNRHFLQVSGSHQRRIPDAACPPQVAAHIISNRQSQILEFTKNPTKTHNSAVLIDTKTRISSAKNLTSQSHATTQRPYVICGRTKQRPYERRRAQPGVAEPTSLLPMIFGRGFKRHLAFHIVCVRSDRYSDSRGRLSKFELMYSRPGSLSKQSGARPSRHSP